VERALSGPLSRSLINSSVIGYLRQASGSYQVAVLMLVAILGAAATGRDQLFRAEAHHL
jgi:hypothetical protein